MPPPPAKLNFVFLVPQSFWSSCASSSNVLLTFCFGFPGMAGWAPGKPAWIWTTACRRLTEGAPVFHPGGEVREGTGLAETWGCAVLGELAWPLRSPHLGVRELGLHTPTVPIHWGRLRQGGRDPEELEAFCRQLSQQEKQVLPARTQIGGALAAPPRLVSSALGSRLHQVESTLQHLARVCYLQDPEVTAF